MATRCISPPLRLLTGSSARSGQADPFQQLQHPGFEVTLFPAGHQCRESHVLPDRQVGQEMEELEDESDLVPAQQGPVAVRIAGQVLPRTSTRPQVGRSMPAAR